MESQSFTMELNKALTETGIITIIEKQCGDILTQTLSSTNLFKLLINAEKKHNITNMSKLIFIFFEEIFIIRSNDTLKLISMHFQEEQLLWHFLIQIMILII